MARGMSVSPIPTASCSRHKVPRFLVAMKCESFPHFAGCSSGSTQKSDAAPTELQDLTDLGRDCENGSPPSTKIREASVQEWTPDESPADWAVIVIHGVQLKF